MNCFLFLRKEGIRTYQCKCPVDACFRAAGRPELYSVSNPSISAEPSVIFRMYVLFFFGFGEGRIWKCKSNMPVAYWCPARTLGIPWCFKSLLLISFKRIKGKRCTFLKERLKVFNLHVQWTLASGRLDARNSIVFQIPPSEPCQA